GVVVAFLRQRGRARPFLERRPSVHVAGTGRAAEVEKVLDLAVGALLVLGAARGKRVWRAERAERGTTVPVAAEQLERGHVGVALDSAPHVALRARAPERGSARVRLGLGVRGASVRG